MAEGQRIVSALLVAAGIAAAGWLVGGGFTKGRQGERTVQVKGLAERDVEADAALWRLRFVATDNELAKAQAAIQKSQDAVFAFLERHGILRAAVEIQALEVQDAYANIWGGAEVRSRFVIQQTLMVRSDRPEVVREASQGIGELVNAGVVLSNEGTGSGPIYLFTKLNEVKPRMIAEATANARSAAEQFAKDSGSRLGAIRRASQGVFVILPRDEAPGVTEEGQFHKRVRVVATIDYSLTE